MRDSCTSRVSLSYFAALAALTACTAPDDSDLISTERRETSAASSPTRDAIPLASDGSLTALTAEVRQLRLTVEELIRSQAETQALSVRLSAQQSRIEQIAGQLDAARSQVDALSVQSQDHESRLASLSAELAGATDREARARLEDVIRNTRDEQTRFASFLQQARDRENELSHALQLEETQWNDLVAGIDQLTR